MNSTFMGFSNKSQIPSSYRMLLENIPKVRVVGPAVMARLNAFGLKVEDLQDADKLWSVFTPKEFIRILKVMNYADECCPVKLCELLNDNFEAVSMHNLQAELRARPTQHSHEYVDQLILGSAEALSVEDYLMVQFGRRDVNPAYLGFSLINVEKDSFVAVLEEWDSTKAPQVHDYNVYVTICDKLFNFYGLRWVFKTKAFATLINLSQLSALSRNS